MVTAENKQTVRINSHGFRDRERSYDKPEGTSRIVVLGNSWTEALQVPLEKTCPALLESDLQKYGCFNGKRVEVFGPSNGPELVALTGSPLLAQIPIDPMISML